MKHIQLITLLILLTALQPARGQFFEKNFQTEFYNDVRELRNAAAGGWVFATGHNAQLSFKTIYLHRIDVQGGGVTIPLPAIGQPEDYDWLEVPGGFIYTARFFDCDISVPRQTGYYSPGGTVLWSKEVSPDDPAYWGHAKLLPGPDSTFWLFNGDRPVRYDLSGEAVDTAAIPLDLFADYTGTADGRLLVYGNGPGIALYNPQLTAFQYGLDNEVVLRVDTLTDGRFVALSSGKLFLLNADLSIAREQAHGVLLDTGNWGDLAAGGSEIWLLSKKTPARLLQYDTLLALVETRMIPAKAPFQPVRLSADAGRLLMIGEEYRDGGPTQVIGMRAVAANAVSFQGTSDAALEDIISLKPPAGYYYPQGNFSHIVFDSVFVVVKNGGPDVLHEVTLNAVLGINTFICFDEHHYRRDFLSLNLPPGDTAVLYAGKVEVSGYYPLPASTALCFWTTLPNDNLDLAYQNNSVCRNFTVIVAGDEPQEFLPLSISPNPAAGLVRVVWPGAPGVVASIRLYDFTGRLVLESTTSGGVWNLERGNLPAGLYQVVVREEGKIFSGKVVWE